MTCTWWRVPSHWHRPDDGCHSALWNGIPFSTLNGSVGAVKGTVGMAVTGAT
jgi:hypothetical protein